MKRGRDTIVLMAFCTMFLIMSAHIQVGAPPLPRENNAVIENFSVPSGTFNFKTTMGSIVNSPSVQNIRDIVKKLSEDYHDRLWYNLDRRPNAQLEGAWTYINNTIIGATGGKVHFKHWTEEMTLVGTLNGSSTVNKSPIIIAGTISSRASPGANMFGASAAAVVESARILSKYNNTNPILFVLTNTVTGMYGTGASGNAGFRAVLDELFANHQVPAFVFWYSYLLYSDPSTPEVVMISTYNQSYFNTQELIAELGIRTSKLADERITKSSGAIGSWRRTGAFDATERGVPSFLFEQNNAWGVPSWEEDVWNYWTYDYDQAAEAVGVVSALTWLLGRVAAGDEPAFIDTVQIGAGGSRTISFPLTGLTEMTASIQWTGNATIRGIVYSPEGAVVGIEESSTGEFTVTCNVTTRGIYSLKIENTGNETATVTYSVTQSQDFDDDSLDDMTEITFGSDPISIDADGDGLDDPDEYALGTNPRSMDSDQDGALDGIEAQMGSNPLIVDSDNDTLSDGFELENGLDPTSNDTDQDGLDDGAELVIGGDPLNPDTDGDGLIDGLEVQYGTNINNTDTDGDGLNDLFEVLNNLDPHTDDTDGDGLSDLYEIENGLLPFSADTDGDSIPDSEDWNPKVHWIYDIPTVGLIATLIITTVWLARKRREYMALEK